MTPFNDERRKFFRLSYPNKQKAILKIGIKNHEILDLSENGLRFQTAKMQKFGTTIRGTINLLSGITLSISGRVMWSLGYEYGIFLDEPISQGILKQEEIIENVVKDYEL